jgi:hypothetical protein
MLMVRALGAVVLSLLPPHAASAKLSAIGSAVFEKV